MRLAILVRARKCKSFGDPVKMRGFPHLRGRTKRYHEAMGRPSAVRQDLLQYVDDPELDGYARRCGLPSGIGRLCLLDDSVLGRVVSAVGIPADSTVLDLGYGHGFLARWLLWNSMSCRCESAESPWEGTGSARNARGRIRPRVRP